MISCVRKNVRDPNERSEDGKARSLSHRKAERRRRRRRREIAGVCEGNGRQKGWIHGMSVDLLCNIGKRETKGGKEGSQRADISARRGAGRHHGPKEKGG
jgi:hypothetical protein